MKSINCASFTKIDLPNSSNSAVITSHRLSRLNCASRCYQRRDSPMLTKPKTYSHLLTTERMLVAELVAIRPLMAFRNAWQTHQALKKAPAVQCSVWILMDFDGFCPESFLCPQSNLLCPSVSFPWWSRACYNLGALAGFRCSAAFWLKHHDEKEGKLLIYKSSIWTSKGENANIPAWPQCS